MSENMNMGEMKASMPNAPLKTLAEALDEKSYNRGEVPQHQLVDPGIILPLNSEMLLSSDVEKCIEETNLLIEAELANVQRHQDKINIWEAKIEKHKATIHQNQLAIKQNNIAITFDKKNRDYWMGRADEVMQDYVIAAISKRHQDWGWLIKKYGLKNADGTEINCKANCVDELCNGEIENLATEYRVSANKYETARKEKELEYTRLVKDNSQLYHTIDTLQAYVAATYTNEIEPLQDGILFLKELGLKFKALQDGKSLYGDMRVWAESFLNDFVKANPRVPQSVVSSFRRLSSIPLPAQNS